MFVRLIYVFNLRISIMELNEKIREKQMSENFILGIMLALTGGFLDAYTYITRGGVFANAQTGNIVLMGINLAKGDFERVIHYVVPILAFALGILLSEIIKATLKKSRHMHWRQIVVLAEIIILAVCGFIPSGKGNTFVNVMVSFVCSLQVETFRVSNSSNSTVSINRNFLTCQICQLNSLFIQLLCLHRINLIK